MKFFNDKHDSLKLLTVKKVTIFMHWTLLLLVGWVLIANTYTGMKPALILWSLLFLAAVIGSLLLHEMAHAFVGGLYGLNARSLILLPVGGVASIERLPGTPQQELAISIAGPLMNVVLAMVLSIFIPLDQPYWHIKPYTGVITADNFVYSLFVVNLLLALVNLIPAFPMDGGRMLRALLGIKLNYIKATTVVAVVGKGVAWVLVIIALLSFNAFFLLIGLFLLLFAGTEEYYFQIKAMVKDVKVKDVVMYDYNQLPAIMTVGEVINVLVSNHAKHFIVMDGGMPAGIINRVEIVKAVAEMKYDETIRNLMQEELKFYNGETDVEKVLDELAYHPDRIYPVLEHKVFAGVISFQHIIEYLLIQKGSTQEYGKVKSLAGLL